MTEAFYDGPLDPIFHLMPDDQLTRVFDQDMVDIDPEFLGFTAIYQSLAAIIPKHWTVVDLGCAYAPQSHLFKDHAAYIGVDLLPKERFSAANSTFYDMTIKHFIDQHAGRLNKDTTFAICSYVPPWQDDNRALARAAFHNLFVYYPCGGTRPFIKKPWDDLREGTA